MKKVKWTNAHLVLVVDHALCSVRAQGTAVRRGLTLVQALVHLLHSHTNTTRKRALKSILMNRKSLGGLFEPSWQVNIMQVEPAHMCPVTAVTERLCHSHTSCHPSTHLPSVLRLVAHVGEDHEGVCWQQAQLHIDKPPGGSPVTGRHPGTTLSCRLASPATARRAHVPTLVHATIVLVLPAAREGVDRL